MGGLLGRADVQADPHSEERMAQKLRLEMSMRKIAPHEFTQYQDRNVRFDKTDERHQALRDLYMDAAFHSWTNVVRSIAKPANSVPALHTMLDDAGRDRRNNRASEEQARKRIKW